MKKAIQILKVLVEKKVLASIMAIIAITIPVTAKWLEINSMELVNSISGILIAVSVILAMYAEKPFSAKDIANKGGKK